MSKPLPRCRLSHVERRALLPTRLGAEAVQLDQAGQPLSPRFFCRAHGMQRRLFRYDVCATRYAAIWWTSVGRKDEHRTLSRALSRAVYGPWERGATTDLLGKTLSHVPLLGSSVDPRLSSEVGSVDSEPLRRAARLLLAFLLAAGSRCSPRLGIEHRLHR